MAADASGTGQQGAGTAGTTRAAGTAGTAEATGAAGTAGVAGTAGTAHARHTSIGHSQPTQPEQGTWGQGQPTSLANGAAHATENTARSKGQQNSGADDAAIRSASSPNLPITKKADVESQGGEHSSGSG